MDELEKILEDYKARSELLKDMIADYRKFYKINNAIVLILFITNNYSYY